MTAAADQGDGAGPAWADHQLFGPGFWFQARDDSDDSDDSDGPGFWFQARGRAAASELNTESTALVAIFGSLAVPPESEPTANNNNNRNRNNTNNRSEQTGQRATAANSEGVEQDDSDDRRRPTGATETAPAAATIRVAGAALRAGGGREGACVGVSPMR